MSEIDAIREMLLNSKADAVKEILDARIDGVEDVLSTLERMFNMRVESLKTTFQSNVETLNARLGTMDSCATKAEVGAQATGQDSRLRSLEERIALHVRGDEYRRGQDALIERISKIENKLSENVGSTRVANAIWGAIALVIVGVITAVLIPLASHG